ncbi:hypothetical protein [Allocoleopsis sp.]
MKPGKIFFLSLLAIAYLMARLCPIALFNPLTLNGGLIAQFYE